MFPIRRMTNDMEKFVDNFFGHQLPNLTGLYPRESSLGATNITENEKEYQVSIMVPGFTKENVKIDVEDDELIIKAEIQDKNESKTDTWHRQEFKHQSFTRSFVLPDDATEEGIKAKVEDGLLTITLEKKTKPTKKNSVNIE